MLFMHTNIYRNGSLFSNKLFSEIFSCVCKLEESISFVSDILKNTQYFLSRSPLQSRIASVCLLVCFYSRESKFTSFLNCFFTVDSFYQKSMYIIQDLKCLVLMLSISD